MASCEFKYYQGNGFDRERGTEAQRKPLTMEVNDFSLCFIQGIVYCSVIFVASYYGCCCLIESEKIILLYDSSPYKPSPESSFPSPYLSETLREEA